MHQLRFVQSLLQNRLKSELSVLDEVRTEFRVLPADLSPWTNHMNNGRYLTCCDLGRYELFQRSGMLGAMQRSGTSEAAASVTMQYRKELTRFQKYTLHTRLVGWDHRFLYFEQKFATAAGIHAAGLAKIILFGAQALSPAQLLRETGYDAEEQRLDSVLSSWNESTNEHWARLTQPE